MSIKISLIKSSSTSVLSVCLSLKFLITLGLRILRKNTTSIKLLQLQRKLIIKKLKRKRLSKPLKLKLWPRQLKNKDLLNKKQLKKRQKDKRKSRNSKESRSYFFKNKSSLKSKKERDARKKNKIDSGEKERNNNVNELLPQRLWLQQLQLRLPKKT
jgi:hypothetical protein